MKRQLKKSISFILATILFFTTFINSIDAYAEEKNNFIVQTVIENKYDDVVEFGDGYLFLEGGKFNDLKLETKFIYVDKNGQQRVIENKYGFTEAFFSISSETSCLDYGTLMVKKDNKVALMDDTGTLFGGNENFYDCILSAGGNLFYTTNSTANLSNKADTLKWTLRKKDGTVIKDLDNFSFSTDRRYVNGKEYLLYFNGKENELITIDDNYNIKSFGSGYNKFYNSDKYVVASKNNKNNKSITVFENNGVKKFEVEGYEDIYIQDLEEKEYAQVYRYSDDKYKYGKCNIIDSNGNLMLDEENSYSEIIDYDNKVALVRDKDYNYYLVDYKNNILFDSRKYCGTLGEDYYINSYYKNSMLAVGINKYDEYNQSNKTIIINSEGEVKLEKDLSLTSFDGKYVVLYDNKTSNYHLVDLYGKEMKTSNNPICLTRNSEGAIAIINNYIDNDILIFEDGKVIDKYNTINEFNGKYAEIWSENYETKGRIDCWGNEIIPLNKYANLIYFSYNNNKGKYANYNYYGYDNNTGWIVGYKEQDEDYNMYYPELIHISGEVVVGENNYKNIGQYTTECNDIRGYYWAHSSRTKIDNTENPLVITVDNNDKIGLIRVTNSQYNSDVNNDGKVNILDLSTVALSYGKKSGDSNWNENVDINYDNFIDLFDLSLVSRKL